MPNPNPKTAHLPRAVMKGDRSMKGRLFVRVTTDVEMQVRSLPNYQDWLREVIAKGLESWHKAAES
jgi:hypothetical protein